MVGSMSIPFSSLSSPQQAQAAALFRDDIFGASSEDYLYEVAAATGLLTGQRSPVKIENGRKKLPRKYSSLRVILAGPLQISDQAAAHFARLILESTVPAVTSSIMAD
jgi:hypothetical protein